MCAARYNRNRWLPEATSRQSVLRSHKQQSTSGVTRAFHKTLMVALSVGTLARATIYGHSE